MSEVVNLTNFGKLDFKTNTNSKNSILSKDAPEATEYLQELQPNNPNIPTLYCLKDVNNPLDDGDIPGPFETYRTTTLTLPAGISYINYHFDRTNPNDPKLNIKLEGFPLKNMVQTFLLLDINAPITNFHYCDDNLSSDHPLTTPALACINTLTSVRGSEFKPFHLFLMDIPDSVTGFYPSYKAKRLWKKRIYLVPFAISEGVVVHFLVKGRPEKQLETLTALAAEIIKTQAIQDGKHHWFITSEIIYQDAYGIFTCTRVKSTNGVVISSI